MENEGLTNHSRVQDWLDEQEWFQPVKSKWDELEPDHKIKAHMGIIAAFLAIVLGSALWAGVGVQSLKKSIQAKKDFLSFLQKSEEEIRDLRSNPRISTHRPSQVNWPQYLIDLGNQNGIDRSSLEAGAEKAGASTPALKETIIGIKARNITVRQLIRYAFALENGAEPVRIAGLTVETIGSEGYLGAHFTLVGTSILEKSQ